jgi:hypothetical protein
MSPTIGDDNRNMQNYSNVVKALKLPEKKARTHSNVSAVKPSQNMDSYASSDEDDSNFKTNQAQALDRTPAFERKDTNLERQAFMKRQEHSHKVKEYLRKHDEVEEEKNSPSSRTKTYHRRRAQKVPRYPNPPRQD